jgi:uncharacterized protein YndB with AHSA1/START domain
LIPLKAARGRAAHAAASIEADAMSETVSFLTTHFERHGQTTVAELRVTLDNHMDEVWAALTRPDRLAQWLAPGEIELRVGGSAKLDFGDSGIVIDSRVSAIEPLRVLEYSWSGPGEPQRPVRWDLEPIGAATVLGLRLSLPAGEDAARAAAGWAAHLDMLMGMLIGAPMKFPMAVFRDARETYGAQLAALGARPSASA